MFCFIIFRDMRGWPKSRLSSLLVSTVSLFSTQGTFCQLASTREELGVRKVVPHNDPAWALRWLWLEEPARDLEGAPCLAAEEAVSKKAPTPPPAESAAFSQRPSMTPILCTNGRGVAEDGTTAHRLLTDDEPKIKCYDEATEAHRC